MNHFEKINKICYFLDKFQKIKMRFFKNLFYISLIQILVIIKSINSFNIEDESSLQQISTLACSAIAKKMTESEDHLSKFLEQVKLFSERIKYDFDQTKNFVNLIILNNCFKEMDYETAGVIIKQRAETKNIETKFLKYLKVESAFEDYSSLDNDKKKELFSELGEVKEHLKGLSDNLGDVNKASQEANKNSGEPVSSKQGERRRKPNIDENNDQDNQKSSNIIVFIMQILAVFMGNIMNLAMENILMLSITITLVFLVSLLGQKRLKKVKKVKNTSS